MKMKVRRFSALVAREGLAEEESFPVNAADYETARHLALVYVLNVLKLKEFELRVIGS
jgi:hypothetical protein